MDGILLSSQTIVAALAALAAAYYGAYVLAWLVAGLNSTPWQWPAWVMYLGGTAASILAAILAFPSALCVFAMLGPEVAVAVVRSLKAVRDQADNACSWWCVPDSLLLPIILGWPILIIAGVLGAALMILVLKVRKVTLLLAAGGISYLLLRHLLATWTGPMGILGPSTFTVPNHVRGLGFLGAVAVAAVLGGFNPLLRQRGWRNNALAIVPLGPGGCASPIFEVTDHGLGTPARHPEGKPGRRIVIFCDGTSNRANQVTDGKLAPTNVWRLYDALEKTELQTGWYDAGVGSGTSSQATKARFARATFKAMGIRPLARAASIVDKLRTALEAATGVGITENMVQAYAEIVRQYRPGDRIYLIGFSRGAYTARCVAGVIRRSGVLRADNMRYAPDVVRLFRARKCKDNNVPIREDLRHKDLPRIEFLGLFDTVASLGMPLWGWWFNARFYFRNVALDTNPSAICRHIYHALAMDERRSQFFPTLFMPQDDEKKKGWVETLDQEWFRGCHSDIGGGYAEPGLSDITLLWMLRKAQYHGLTFDPRLKASLKPEPFAPLHDQMERQQNWRVFGSWPRWHPVMGVPGDEKRYGQLHASVLARRDAVESIGRPDQTVVGFSPVEFLAAPQREWDRTGLVLEGGGRCYQLSWTDKSRLWRDLDCTPCGPRGQPDRSDPLTGMRRYFRDLRRMPDADWMALCITIAHPRDWLLRECGLTELWRYLMNRDPHILQWQVASIGQKLEEQGTVVIQNKAAAGLLHLFANDTWATAGNNSGTIALSIKRVQNVTPDFVLEPLNHELAEKSEKLEPQQQERLKQRLPDGCWKHGSYWIKGAP